MFPSDFLLTNTKKDWILQLQIWNCCHIWEVKIIIPIIILSDFQTEWVIGMKYFVETGVCWEFLSWSLGKGEGLQLLWSGHQQFRTFWSISGKLTARALDGGNFVWRMDSQKLTVKAWGGSERRKKGVGEFSYCK